LIIALIAFVAQKGSPLFAFQIFFTLSLGLGLPYLFLGTFAGLLQKLPKSGVWLILVDRLFGTILLSVAAFYLILATDSRLLPWLLPAALIFGGIYLGFIERSKNYKKKLIVFKRIAGGAAIIAGILIHVLAPRQNVAWEKYDPAKFEQVHQKHQPVIMDFYADWCIPCHELDQYVYTSPQVIEKLTPFAHFKVDLTNPDDPAIQVLIDKYEILGVPTILFLDGKGEEIKEARVTGFIPAQEFLQLLDETVLKK
jgi:thiol:disulfide interchange protein DsbD